MKYARTLVLFSLALTLATPAYSVPELYKVSCSGSVAPVFINYTLNCVADMTFEIYPCDSSGNISGPKIKTDFYHTQAKGPHTYLWACIDDAGMPAPSGYYVCKLTATANPASFSRLFGSHRADDPVPMYDSWIPIPMPDIWGFYGASVNTNPASPYYGRIYAGNVNTGNVEMWDCDGTYLGVLDDTDIGWGEIGRAHV